MLSRHKKIEKDSRFSTAEDRGHYVRPQMQVVELRQEAPLVCTSEGIENYQRENPTDW